jgi:hypothetical protein
MKNIIKSIWKKLIFWAINYGYTQLFKFIDSDNNGELSDQEIREALAKLQLMVKLLKTK